MADNTKIGPIFRGANGGLSDDLFTGIRNSFYYSNDMEIREDAKSIFPKKVPAYADDNTKITIGDGHTNTWQVKCVIKTSGDGWVVACTKSIYEVNFNTQTATLLCTMGEEIADVEVFNGYVYVSTQTGLYYKKDNGGNWGDMAASTDDSVLNYGKCTTALLSNYVHPLYASDVCLVVGDKHIVHKVTRETPSLLQDGFEIQEGEYIKHINELGGYVRIVAQQSIWGSEVYLWDKVSNVATEVIPLEGYQVIGSAIYNGYHYLLSNRGLGLLNGYQYYLLKKTEGDVDTTIRNCMCVYNDNLYFVTTEGVYIYGAKNKNYADVLGLWHKVEDGYDLGAIAADSHGIVITKNSKYSSGTYYPIVIGYNYGQATTGEVQTMCYFGTSMSEIKQAMYLRVGYHLGKEGNNSGDIHIYYRTEADATTDNPEDWQRHPIQENDVGLSATWDMRSPFATSIKLNCRFQWIQFKFVLTNCVYTEGGVTKTKDTNLYSADLYYNDMLD